MPRLWLIGNGFDIANGIDCRYSDFRLYWKKKYKFIKSEYPVKTYDAIMSDDFSDEDLRRIAARLLAHDIKLDQDDWHNFEEALYHLPLDKVTNKYRADMADETGQIDEVEAVQANVPVQKATDMIKKLFAEWINHIELPDARDISVYDKIKDLFNREDYFMNFNYTLTLEEVYDISSDHICHIHGWQGNPEIIVGHGHNEHKPYDDIDNDFLLNEVYQKLRKPVEERYNRNKAFFEIIRSVGISEIASYGFSFSEVDMFYVRKLAKLLGDGVPWLLNNFGGEAALEKQKEGIKNNGFKKAVFTTYGIRC